MPIQESKNNEFPHDERIEMTIQKVVLIVSSVASIALVGCDGGNDTQTTTQRQEPIREEEVAVNPSVSTPVAKKYQDALARFLTIRKSRENLSYSVASKVGEEMVAFQSLSTNDQERKLKELEKQLEEYE